MKYKKIYKYILKLLEQTNYLKIRPYAYMERTINDIALEYLEDINCFLKRIKKFNIFYAKSGIQDTHFFKWVLMNTKIFR